LTSLRGLDPWVSVADGQFLTDVQHTLWPRNFEYAAQHRDWLESVGLSEKGYDYEMMARFKKCREEMLSAIDRAVMFINSAYGSVMKDMRDFRAGGDRAKGAQRAPWVQDAKMFNWIQAPALSAPTSQLDASANMTDVLSVLSDGQERQSQIAETQAAMMQALLASRLEPNEPAPVSNDVILAMIQQQQELAKQNQQILMILAQQATGTPAPIAPEPKPAEVAEVKPELVTSEPERVVDEEPTRKGNGGKKN